MLINPLHIKQVMFKKKKSGIYKVPLGLKNKNHKHFAAFHIINCCACKNNLPIIITNNLNSVVKPKYFLPINDNVILDYSVSLTSDKLLIKKYHELKVL